MLSWFKCAISFVEVHKGALNHLLSTVTYSSYIMTSLNWLKRLSACISKSVCVPNIFTMLMIVKCNVSGRVHSAIVASVNLETRSVAVEWFERGETKGKEIEIDAILALNPELASGPRHHTPHLQPMPNKLARVCYLFHL